MECLIALFDRRLLTHINCLKREGFSVKEPNGSETFRCPACNQSFGSHGNLWTHVARQHAEKQIEVKFSTFVLLFPFINSIIHKIVPQLSSNVCLRRTVGLQSLLLETPRQRQSRGKEATTTTRSRRSQ